MSIILQQPLDVIELDLRPRRIGETAAQLLENAADALDVDLAGNLLREIVDVAGVRQRPAERIRRAVGLPAAAVARALARLVAVALLHRIGQALRALA